MARPVVSLQDNHTFYECTTSILESFQCCRSNYTFAIFLKDIMKLKKIMFVHFGGEQLFGVLV